MKHSSIKVAAFIFILCTSMALPAKAATKQDVQNEISSLEDQQSSLESELAALKANKKDVESYIKELDSKLSDILEQMTTVSDEIESTDADIEEAKEKLATAQKDQETQYAALKARIKAMYESGDDASYLDVILGDADLREMMNTQEYKARINMYDYNLLDSLERTSQQISSYEQQLEEKQAQLEESKSEYEAQQADLETVYNTRQEELSGLNESISSTALDISSLEDAIDAQNAKMAEIIKAEEEAAKEAAEAKAAKEKAAKKAAAQKAAAEAKKRQEKEAAERAAKEAAEKEAEEAKKSSSSSSSSWTGPKLTKSAGTVQGPSGKETYYNLDMSGVVSIMRNMGFSESEYPYWVRDDGCKMLGDYIMCAANLNVHPRGTTVECSLGTCLVCDTGGFAYSNPTQLDIATNW